jgi:tRNA guanosine-2'-O-methyltransferase
MADEESILVQLILDHSDDGVVNESVHQISKFQQRHLDSFWASSFDLKEQEETKLYRSWLQWILPDQSTQFPVELLSRNIYFLLLLRGLSSPSPERIKLCLFILKRSVRLANNGIHTGILSFTESNHESTQLVVEKYCAIFEATVLSRYSNQVEECMKILPKSFLHSQEPTAEFLELHSSWWIVLFTAALALENAANVQKIVGGCILAQDISKLDYSEHLGKFLAKPFLQWASQGSLFTATLRRDGQEVRCEHGSRLSQFISNVMCNSANIESRNRFTRVILDGLREHKAGSHAITFIVQGLNVYSRLQEDYVKPVKATEPNRKYKFSDSSSRLATSSLSARFFQTSNFPIHLQNICDYHLTEILDMTDNFKFFEIGTAATSFPSKIDDPHKEREFSDVHSLSSFLADPKNDRVLVGPRLDRSLDLLKDLISSQKGDLIQSLSLQSYLLIAFERIWGLSERQRHRKYVLESIPSILYQSTVLQVAAVNNEMKAFLSECLLQLLHLANTRIYVWNPLAQAIRRAYFQVPNLTSILSLQIFLEEFSNHPPTPTLQYLLECAVSQGLTDYIDAQTMIWYADESYGHACVFDVMNRLKENDVEMGKSIIATLLDPWVSNETLSGSSAFPKEISILQAIVILTGKSLDTAEEVNKFRKDVITCLGLGIYPSARYLFQWMIIASYWRNAKDLASIESLRPFLEFLQAPVGENVSPKIVVSFLRIGICLASHPGISTQFIEEFMCVLPTFATSDKVAIRHEAQWTVPKLMLIASKKNIATILQNKSYVFLDRFIRSLRTYQSPPKIWRMEEFVPERDQNLTMLFEGAYLQLSSLIWNGPNTKDFMRIYEDDARVPQLELPERYLSPGKSVAHESQQSDTRRRDSKKETGVYSIPLQLKSTLSIDAAVSSEKEMESARVKSSVILVASLIDSPYNLGGLSRAAEVFGCAELHVSNISIIKDHAFATTSMSSEAHFNIVQTPLNDLITVLRTMKTQGWTILGIEQTDSSLILGEESTKLPLKAVIVMGAEKTGIPADVLLMCDKFIEIKQWGITRSLNVQTAAATVLYEYRRQWADSTPEKVSNSKIPLA